MLTTECYRSNPLSSNTSLNIHRDSGSSSGYFVSSPSSSSFGGQQSSGMFGGVPVDRPIFVNTQMTGSQCVDLYRQSGAANLSFGEPTLQLASRY